MGTIVPSLGLWELGGIAVGKVVWRGSSWLGYPEYLIKIGACAELCTFQLEYQILDFTDVFILENTHNDSI